MAALDAQRYLESLPQAPVQARENEQERVQETA
jgi:hypothetical protein